MRNLILFEELRIEEKKTLKRGAREREATLDLREAKFEAGLSKDLF